MQSVRNVYVMQEEMFCYFKNEDELSFLPGLVGFRKNYALIDFQEKFSRVDIAVKLVNVHIQYVYVSFCTKSLTLCLLKKQ